MIQSENARGALMMIAGMAAFTFNDTSMKLLGDSLPLFQSLFWRGIGVSLVLFGMAIRAGALRDKLSRQDNVLLILRTATDTATTWFFLQALYHTPIANLTAILQALPLTVSLGAALFLGEPLGWRRLLAIAVGFIGVLLVVRPEAAGFDRYALFGLIAVALVTARDLLTRKMSRQVPSLRVALWNAVAVTAFGAIGSFGESWMLPGAADFKFIAAAGLCIIGGYLLTVMAVRTGEMSFVTPFRYTGLVWALILGLLVFQEWPSPVQLLGAALIVGTGLFTFYRERAIAARAQSPARR